MDGTYRFRFLIYLAAFMLVMSLCFVYAEPLPSQNPLLFQTTPQHSGFLAATSEEPSFDPSALRVAVPVVSPAAMQQLESAIRTRRSFFRHPRNTPAARFPVQVPMGPWNASSVVRIIDDGPSSTAR